MRDIINTRRAALFGHIVRLHEQMPAHHPGGMLPLGRMCDTWFKPVALGYILPDTVS